MAKLVYALNQSLDGYVDYMEFAPDTDLFRHFIEDVRASAGTIYGRNMYEVMRYWDEEHPEWGAPEREYAEVWRKQPKWVVSGTLKSVGPNATLVSDNLEATVRDLKSRLSGYMEVSGPQLAHSLSKLGLIDEYRMYLHPVVIGAGKRYFAGPLSRLRLTATDRIGADVIRLTYVPA
ncbi:dihydrofolate reductase family protein [Hyphomonas sp. WL0036]|uniref:dihydrofolate reductase family protein n=1 Tax=Hyphomonas sediminis TaxID=2866160 RepID=UPI001C7E1EFE|nr:dihydrofolate reductase family protein [Hyphomonas sediminis]MBY9067356.1 dihydrofolate reductase family protein [Hyphomonas sediminis]